MVQTLVSTFPNILICGKDDKIIYNGRLTKYSPNEEVIRRESVLYYNEANPCYLRKAVIIKKILMDMEEIIKAYFGKTNQKIKWAEVPLELKECFDRGEKIESLYIFWDEN